MENRKIRSLVLSLFLSEAFFAAGSAYGDLIDDVEELDSGKKKPPPSPSSLPTKPGSTSVTSNSEDIEPEMPLPKASTTPQAKNSQPNAATPQAGPTASKTEKKSAPVKRDPKAKKAPIHFKSDGKTTYTKNGGVIHLSDNVVITQDELRLQADEASVYLASAYSTNDVERVEIFGHVKVTKFSLDPAEKVTARGDRAHFDNKERKVVLVGNARLWRGGHLVKGDEISYDLVTGIATMQKVDGVVQPEDAKK